MGKVKYLKLANKLPVIIAPVKGTETVTALVMVKTGSKYEQRRNNGLSHFLEHMFFKGTKKRPNTLALASELDVLGGDYNAFTTKEYTGYYVKMDRRQLAKGVEILGDMLINSKFLAEEIERERGVIIEEINMYEDNPQASIEDVFEACLYGDTPAGWDVIGTRENIKSLTRDDFLSYVQTQYGVNSTFIILAGNITEHTGKKLVKKFFKDYTDNNFQDKEKVLEQQTTPAIKVKFKETDQAHLCLGVRAFPAGHPDEFALKLLNVVLGGSMSSRLFIELRERRGLCYYISSRTELATDAGYLVTQAGVPVDKLEEAIKVILEEYKKITTTLVSRAELQRAKDLIQGKLTIQLESSDSLASWYGRQTILRPKLMTPEEFLKQIKHLKPKDLQKVAKKVFVNAGLNLAIIGPVKDEVRIKNILSL